MRKLIVGFFGVLLLGIVGVPVVEAAPSTVNVRIEGKEETLFEKRIPVSIKNVKASSDTQGRACDGINELDPLNTAPGVTPTLASAEAMESIGETFDGKWYDGFNDYFITRWGPDAQVPAADAYWGILVNEVYTNVGGCQYQLDENDEAVWIWDAFNFRPTLAIFPEAAHYTDGPRPTRAVAQVSQPFNVEVAEYPDNGSEGVPCDEPSRANSDPYSGATVAPVEVNAKGFQRIDTASPEAVTSNSAGKASIVFETPGIHRIKGTVGEPGAETTVVRSNGLEVCVAAIAGECDGFATPATNPGAACHPTPPSGGGGQTSSPAPSTSTPPAAVAKTGPPLIKAKSLDRHAIAAGKVGVSWKVLDPGAGIKKWEVASKAVGRKHARFVVRASGRTPTKATLKLPPGATYQLRLTITGTNGTTKSYGLGKVTIPRGKAG